MQSGGEASQIPSLLKDKSETRALKLRVELLVRLLLYTWRPSTINRLNNVRPRCPFKTLL